MLNLTAKLDELLQEDQGSTMRIEELERQRDLLRSAVGHVHQVHQNSTALHDELGELRQRLRQQEELQVRCQQAWKQELEAARGQHHQVSQQSSSVPISSKF